MERTGKKREARSTEKKRERTEREKGGEEKWGAVNKNSDKWQREGARQGVKGQRGKTQNVKGKLKRGTSTNSPRPPPQMLFSSLLLFSLCDADQIKMTSPFISSLSNMFHYTGRHRERTSHENISYESGRGITLFSGDRGSQKELMFDRKRCRENNLFRLQRGEVCVATRRRPLDWPE